MTELEVLHKELAEARQRQADAEYAREIGAELAAKVAEVAAVLPPNQLQTFAQFIRRAIELVGVRFEDGVYE